MCPKREEEEEEKKRSHHHQTPRNSLRPKLLVEPHLIVTHPHHPAWGVGKTGGGKGRYGSLLEESKHAQVILATSEIAGITNLAKVLPHATFAVSRPGAADVAALLTIIKVAGVKGRPSAEIVLHS